MDAFRGQTEKDPFAGITFSPPDIVRRQHAAWNGIKADIVEITRLDRLECGVKSSHHVLIACERAEREDGETVVEGFRRSTQREFSRKLCFIPAGHRFHGWQDPRVLARGTFLYIDPTPRSPTLSCDSPRSNSLRGCSFSTTTSGRPRSS
jgi:AraC family transcriptional regulator